MKKKILRRYGDNQFELFRRIRGQLVFWKAGFGFSVDFFDGDGDRDFGFSLRLILIGIYLSFEDALPAKWQPKVDWKKSFSPGRRFTFYYFERAFWFALWQDDIGSSREQPWYMRTFVFHLPWDYEWVRTSTLKKDGTWFHELRGDKKKLGDWKAWKKLEDEIEPQLWKEVYPYTYVLRSGDIQNVQATVKVEEREWRWRWFKWLPFPRIVSKTIDVNFSEEVGEGRGSWKGGTLGCGYAMLPRETPLDTLRRMERERKFER
jgi:hypothetical protein